MTARGDSASGGRGERGARPADVARRALREARERERAAKELAEPGEKDTTRAGAEANAGASAEPAAAQAPGAAPAANAARAALAGATATGGVKPGNPGTAQGANTATTQGTGPATTRGPKTAHTAASGAAAAGDPSIGRATQGRDDTAGTADGPADGAPQGQTPGPSSSPGARPGDVAREALRAARARGRTDEGASSAEPSAGPAGSGKGDTRDGDDWTGGHAEPGSAAPRRARNARPKRGTPRPTAGASPNSPAGQGSSPRDAASVSATVRDLRKLLSGGFKLPKGTDVPDEAGVPNDVIARGGVIARGDADGRGDAYGRHETDARVGTDARGETEARDGADTRGDRDARHETDARGDADAPDSAAVVNAPERHGGWDAPSPGAPPREPVDRDEPTADEPVRHPSSRTRTAHSPDRPRNGDNTRQERTGWASAPYRRPEPEPRDAPEHATAPAVPRTMATPHRDGDLRRTFAALPARPSANDAPFATSWWGNAWVTALEEGALDQGRLTRGRAYAKGGHVDAITVTPGLVLAYVQGSRVRPYRVQVRLRTLDDDAWERFLDAAADRPGHIAALLDGEVPPSLADCGVPLLPQPGDLDPHCGCPDSGRPCKHAAALCYQTARLLDADPFMLFLLRGRGEREVLDDLSRRSAARAARAAQDKGPAPLPGVRATEALAPRTLPPLPRPQQAPPHPGQPPVYPGVPGGPDSFVLDQLATDAAARAHALLTTGHDPVGGLSLWEDAVRLAAARPGSGLTAATRTLYSSLSAAAGRSPGDLARAVAAWRQGGHEGLAVLEEEWDPPAGRFDRARALLLAAGLPPFRPRRNRLTHPKDHVQLRFGRDGVWYAYESEPGHDDWWPRGTPDLDPVGALTGVAGPDGV